MSKSLKRLTINIIVCSNSRFEQEAPVLRGRPPVSSWNLLFWDDPGLNVKHLWIFQVDHTFYKLHVKILATSNKITCVHCSWPPCLSWAVDLCQQKHLAKEVRRISLRINTVWNFESIKSAVELNRLLLKLVLLYQVHIQESSCEDNTKLNFLVIIWESKRSWRVHLSGF